MDPMDEDTPDVSHEQHPPPPSAPAAAPSGAGTKHPAPVSTPADPSAPSSEQGDQGASKRRRGLGVVTPNACTECRKKRAKCDGGKPCGRCKGQKGVECVYEVPVRQSKETLRHEIEQLRRQQRNSDQVFSALVRPDLWEEVLSRLRTGQTVEGISEWLGGALPSSGGALSALARSAASGASLPALTGFTGGATGAYAAMAPGPGPGPGTGLGAASPVSSHHPQGFKHEGDQPSPSPWGGPFSAHSQTLSTRSDSHPDIMSWSPDTVRGPPQALIGSWVESQEGSGGGPSGEGQRFRGLDQILAAEDMRVSPSSWTKVTSDARLVQHLLALYFCWEYPTFASLSKEHFLRDFQDGRARYCSSILVNALLALGCRFSSQPSTRANPDDPYTSGDHFFKESQRLFYQEENHHNLTTIQALGIMSIREASCGRDSESWYYAGQSIRLAIEMGLHRLSDDGGADDESAVQAATFWGAFALDHAWSLATGSLPQCSCFPRLPPKPAIIDDIEASLWIPYTDDGKGIPPAGPALEEEEDAMRLNLPVGAPLQRSCEQPSNVRSVYKCFCELSELVHQSLYILHSPGRPLTARDLLSIYTQYLNWYDRIPEVLRLGHNFTPAVLFAHMYYHFAILLLFRPLIKLRIVGSAISPRDVCLQAAGAIQGLLRSYSRLYTLRRTPSFVPYFVLTSAIMHLAIMAATPPKQQALEGGDSTQGEPSSPDDQKQKQSAGSSKVDPHVSEAIANGIADLTEMAPCHHFAEQALNILRYLAKKWNIDVSFKASDSQAEEAALTNREHLVRPVTSSLNFFAPNVAEADFICSWGAGTESGLGADMRAGLGGTSGPERLAQVANAIENPLFWPFPMQGRPMLPTGPELKDAGFEML